VSLESPDGGAPSGDDAAADASPDSSPDGGASDAAGDTAGDAGGDAAPQVLVMGLDQPAPIASDAMYVYYAVVGSNSIWRMNKDGSGLLEVANGDFVLGPSAVATDGTSFYFTDDISSSSNVYDCPVAGCGTSNDTAFATANFPLGITVAGGTVYWTSGGTGVSGGAVTSRASNDMGATIVLFTATDNSSPMSVAVDGNDVYFTDNENGSFRRVQADGNGLVDLTAANEPGSSLGVAVGNDSVFFTTGSSGGPGAVWSVTKSSGVVNETFATNQATCVGIATDSTNVYWVDQGSISSATGSVMWCPQSGCPSGGPTELASAQAAPYGITVDDSFVYWTNTGVSQTTNDGSVSRIAKP
jgi:hypothetical protein